MKHRCRVSLMAGVLSLARLSTVLDSFVRVTMIKVVDLDSAAGQESRYSVFHTKFSDWTNKWNQVIGVQNVRPVPLAAVVLSILLELLSLIAVLSQVMVMSNLRVKPIIILNGRGRCFFGKILITMPGGIRYPYSIFTLCIVVF